VRERLESELVLKASTESETAVKGKMKASKEKIAEVKEFLEKKGSEVSAEVKLEAEAQLKKAEEYFAQAEVKLAAKSYNKAFVLFQTSLREAQEVHTILIQNHASSQNTIRVQVPLLNEVKSDTRSNTHVEVDANSVQSDVDVEVQQKNSSEQKASTKTDIEIKGGVQIGL
jgi:hypothetical protein